MNHETAGLASAWLNEFFGDCMDVLLSLENAAQRLQAAIEGDIQAKRLLRDLEAALSAAEAEKVAEAAIMAKVSKEGPLAAVAQSSPAFLAARDALIAEAHRGDLADLLGEVARARREADDAQLERERAAVMFSALKHAADLRASMLNAAS